MMAVSYEELMEKKLDRIDDRRDKRQDADTWHDKKAD